MSRSLSSFYSLTFWAAALEICIPISWYLSGQNFLFIGLGMTLFHAGYLVSGWLSRLRLPTKIVWIFYLSSVCLLGVSFILQNNLYFQLASAFFASLMIRYLRNCAKENIKFSKQANGNFRQIGYAVGGLISLNWFIVTLLGLVTAILILINLAQYETKNKVIVSPGFPKNYAHLFSFEFFHSLHYFAYCYFLLLIFWKELGKWGVLCGIIFAMGWTGYSVLYAKLREYKPGFVFWGHLINAVAIFLMAFKEELLWLTILWVITGIGGGTNFAIRFGISDNASGFSYYREKAEDWGHVLGPILGAVVAIFMPGGAVFKVASIMAAFAAISMLFEHKLITEHRGD